MASEPNLKHYLNRIAEYVENSSENDRIFSPGPVAGQKFLSVGRLMDNIADEQGFELPLPPADEEGTLLIMAFHTRLLNEMYVQANQEYKVERSFIKYQRRWIIYGEPNV